jgi:NADH:ubiquinone oxidoreductase subunit F (NADH-binding)
MAPDAVIEAVKASGLRGRGGAGFPDRHEVAVRRQEIAEAQVHLLQTPTRASPARSKTTC